MAKLGELEVRIEMPTPTASARPLLRAPSDCRSGEAVSGVLDGSGLQLGPLLGSGAFGAVYRARWDGADVAAKVVLDPEAASELRKEADVLSRISHPHVVCFIGVCQLPSGHCAIVQELMHGGSLYALLHGSDGGDVRPLGPREATRLGENVASAVAYLHSSKLVHRDLKSPNVLLDAARRSAKVCDFSLAKWKERTMLSTAHGGQAGTPAYMAPEIFTAGSVSESCDAFSFGVVLWEMLSGEIPWKSAHTPLQIVYAVGVQKLRLPLPSDCPPPLAELIRECWAEAPSQRPPFSAIVERLRDLLPGAPAEDEAAADHPTR